MNLKGLTAPLTQKIGDLTSLIQEIRDNLEKQIELLEKINENLSKDKEDNN